MPTIWVPALDSGRSPRLTRSVALLALELSRPRRHQRSPSFAFRATVFGGYVPLLATMGVFSAPNNYYFKFLGDNHARLLYLVAGPRIRSRSVKP